MDPSLVSLATSASSARTSESFSGAVMAKSLGAVRMQGQQALQLIQSATGSLPLASSGAVGRNVNVMG